MKKNLRYTVFLGLMILLTACASKSGEAEIEKTEKKVSSAKKSAATKAEDVLTDDKDWDRYPEDNIFGLAGIAKESEEGSTTLTLAFHFRKDSEIDSHIIAKYSSLSGMSKYGYFDFDTEEVEEQGDYFYVTVTYDSRIKLNTLLFDVGEERCNIDIEDGVSLTYCDFRNPELSKWTDQSYDAALQAWSDTGSRQQDNNLSSGIDHHEYTRLSIDSSSYEPANKIGSVTFSASDYKYRNESYNIYGEIETEAVTTLSFVLWDEDKTPDEQDFFRLYKADGGEYKEITPSDCAIIVGKGYDENHLYVDMESNALGELTEGDYRAEYGKYSVDFQLSMIREEVW